MKKSGQAFLVAKKGDSLWSIVRQAYSLSSNAAISEHLNALLKVNPHIKNPDRIHPGQVIYLQAQSGFRVSPPSSQDLTRMEQCFVDCSPPERDLLLDSWEFLTVFDEAHPYCRDSFVDRVSMSPSTLQSQLGRSVSSQITNSRFSVVAAGAWKFAKTGAKTGSLAMKGKFGNLVESSAWARVEGELVRSLKTEARYIRQSNEVLRLVPRDARALNMSGKIIVVSSEGSSFEGFSTAVAKGKALGKALSTAGKVAKVIDLGLAINKVRDKWDTPERGRTIAVEGAKFAGGVALAEVTSYAASGVCAVLTLTTGPGGIACFATVLLGTGYLTATILESAGNSLYDAATVIYEGHPIPLNH